MPAVADNATTLVFRWPAHLRCEVEHKVQLGRGGRGATERYQLEARRERGGWVIRRTYFGGSDDRGVPETQERIALKADMLPSFRIRANGSFAGLVIDPATRQRIRVRERAWEADMRAHPERQVPGVPRMPYAGSEGRLEVRARVEWMDLVESWVAGVLEPGVTLTQKGSNDLALPFLGPRRLKLVERRQLVATVPCAPGRPSTCVELQSVVEPDVAGLNRALDASARKRQEQPKATPPEEEIAFERFEIRKTLVTDPSTLVPVTFTRRMTTSFERDHAKDDAVETTAFACIASPVTDRAPAQAPAAPPGH
jgi:hypothetical protein